MFERFAKSARAAVEDARYEAERRGDRRIGTEHLLIALLQDDAIAQIIGVDATAAHEAADELDRSALIAIGLVPGDFQPRGSAALGKHVPLTSGAKTVLVSALANTTAEKARAITARHLLLAIFDVHLPDPAAVLLAALPVDRTRVRERLAAAA
jgi:ATP-dependent Clp protease ATP-binding subunit ClpA